MNDARARLPEADTVLGSRGSQEVVHFLVEVLSAGQVLGSLDLGGEYDMCTEKTITKKKFITIGNKNFLL